MAPLRMCLLLLVAFAFLVVAQQGPSSIVTWDPFSLMINGDRVYIFSGEFHYERLPVPELWRDVLEKFKANGLNAISVYFFWSYHSARKGEFDFTSPGKDIQHLLDIAKDVGLYVIARPGPYCNAETNGGGLALWGSDGSLGTLRTSDETYHQSWLPFIRAVGAILAKNQIDDNAGPVILYQIENELQETRHETGNTLVVYMQQIEAASRAVGITVPFSSNEKGMRSMSWSTDYLDVGGAVDVYGLDSYPGGLSCTNTETGFNLVRTYLQWFQNYSSSQPEFLPEFEGGWFSAWGGGTFYDQCAAEHDPAFADVYYKNNIGQRVTLQNIYMTFGGTNWGNLAAPVVYTSYDYSAPLRETREVQLKFKQMKLIGLFTRVSQDLRKTAMESNGTGNAVSSNDIFSWVLRNPDTAAGFYVLQHSSSPSRAVTTFQVHLSTSVGVVNVGSVQLNGRQSKIVTTDYRFGMGQAKRLLYCTADVLTWGTFGGTEVLVLYAEVGQISEFAFAKGLKYQIYGTTKLVSTPQAKGYTSFTYTQTSGSTVVRFEDGTIVYLLEKQTAWNFFAPALTSDPNVAPDQQMFVLGPYNVRSASIAGKTVALIGDNANTTTLEVFAGNKAQSISWNGKILHTKRTAYGSLIATAPGAETRNIHIPALSWKVANSLPETDRNYDDSNWVICNKTFTLSPVAPLTLPVLFSSDYGYYAGIKVYRGRFNGSTATSANITVQGGRAAGFSAWLNGKLVGFNQGDPALSAVSNILDFGGATLYATKNVLTVLTDYTGHDETSTGPAGVENPRGILGVTLSGRNGTSLNFSSWKMMGNAGGNANIDPVRGPMNEDGLYGTRLGWHLPGFDTSGWSAGSPLDGLNASGVAWYISTFELGIDADLDVPLGMEFGAEAGTVASVQLYVNGYQYGKYIPHIGPQTRFPIPPGVINNWGMNTVAVAVWAMTDAGAKLTDASLFAYEKYQTGASFGDIGKGLQPGWSKDRLNYA